MATRYGTNRDVGYNNITMNTDPYKEALEEALFFKNTNIFYMNSGRRYDPIKPTIWLQLLGLLETLEIIQAPRKHNK